MASFNGSKLGTKKGSHMAAESVMLYSKLADLEPADAKKQVYSNV